MIKDIEQYFEVGEVIEMTNDKSFSGGGFKAKFCHRDPGKGYWGVDEKGLMRNSAFARKVAPKVMVVLHFEGSTVHTRMISKSLADKILRGVI
tara:strand:- start:2929 stop:3207 length:279 start_codon:yes stop_codon:yes gene_type:complete